MRLRPASLDVVLKRRVSLRAEAILHGAEHEAGDSDQLPGSVVRKIDVMSDTRGEPGIAAEEGVHTGLVARQNHDEIRALVFHDL